MKFRFWHTYTNARSERTYGSSVVEGNGVHVRGWDAGVTVTPRVRSRDEDACTDADELDVYMTWGSNGGQRSVQIGTVHDTDDGPMWSPADVPAIYTRTDALPRLRKHRRQRAYQAPAAPQDSDQSEDRPTPRLDATLAGPADTQEDPHIAGHLPSGHRIPAGPALDPRVWGPGYES
jgi:hypothetical protein